MGVYSFDTSSQLTTLGILHNLSYNESLVKEIHQKGGTVYILHQLFHSDNPEVKVTAAELLQKLMNDPSQGASICEALQCYLPISVIKGLKAGECRNRLNWNKEKARSKVKEEVNERFKAQQENTELFWTKLGTGIHMPEAAENRVEEREAEVETEAEVKTGAGGETGA